MENQIEKGDPRLKNFTAKRDLIFDLCKRFDVDPKDIIVTELTEDCKTEENEKDNNKR